MTETTHPVWCDRARCTAPAEQPTRETYTGAGTRGQHLSAEVEGFDGAKACFAQGVAPWETSVYLQIDADWFNGRISFELDPASPLLLMARQVVAYQQARYPTLVPSIETDGSSAA